MGAANDNAFGARSEDYLVTSPSKAAQFGSAGFAAASIKIPCSSKKIP
jgi:hypothetical protein